MPLFRRVESRPALRSAIRRGVRAGLSDEAILADVEDRFPRYREGTRTRYLREEHRSQSTVDRLMSRRKTERTNLHALAGCSKGEIVEASITLHAPDDGNGRPLHFTHITQLKTQGRIQDIINHALREAIADAIGRGYTPPHITSSMTGGSTYYVFNYIGCR